MDLERKLFAADSSAAKSRSKALPHLAAIHEEFERHKHARLELLWQEYRAAHSDGYQHRNLEKKRATMAALLPTNYQAAKRRSSAVGQSAVTDSLSRPEFVSATPNSRYDRDVLYERVWKLTIRILAKEYGVSDVALAKACRRLHVPLPGRGYWAKKAANRPVEARPPLPQVAGTSGRAAEG